MPTRNDSPNVRRGDTLRLLALLDGTTVGEVHQDQSGGFRFLYLDSWRNDADAYPVSLSMPLSGTEHGHEVTSAYLWGLLPDNSRTLEQYGRRFHVSPRNPIALLEHLGADCAGAIQFARPDNVDFLLAQTNTEPQMKWLSVDEVAAELRNVRKEGIPSADTTTTGQFSLAGAQPKIALLEVDGRWARPSGRTPTNRILKPPSVGLPGFAENEHFCLELARRINLGAVKSRVLRFGDEVAIVVDRFDRQKIDDRYYRIHQEDMCQALGVMPTSKYENEGGPSILDIVTLLRDSSQEAATDVDRFLRAMVLNWIIVATDGHAKNYALLHGRGSTTRLAPFYDIASYLPYSKPELYKLKLAMKIGSQYSVRRITRSGWEALADSIGVRVSDVLALATTVADSVASSAEVVRQEAINEGLDKDVINPLADRIKNRASTCLAVLRHNTATAGEVAAR